MNMQKDLVFYPLAMLGAACFAIVFRTPRRYLPLTIAVGCLAATGLHVFPAQWHLGFATFITTLVVGITSQLAARFTGAPAQCFLIPAIMFLVPGTWIYRSFSAALESRIEDAARLGLTALTITVGISFGVLLANWIAPLRRSV